MSTTELRHQETNQKSRTKCKQSVAVPRNDNFLLLLLSPHLAKKGQSCRRVSRTRWSRPRERQNPPCICCPRKINANERCVGEVDHAKSTQKSGCFNRDRGRSHHIRCNNRVECGKCRVPRSLTPGQLQHAAHVRQTTGTYVGFQQLHDAVIRGQPDVRIYTALNLRSHLPMSVSTTCDAPTRAAASPSRPSPAPSSSTRLPCTCRKCYKKSLR